MKSLKLLLIAFLFPLVLSAQQWEGGIFLGGSNYEGDVVVPSLFELSETNFGYGLLIRYHMKPQWALRGNLFFGKMTGTDLNFTDPAWRQQRGFSFESSLTEISLKLEWSPLAKDHWLDLNHPDRYNDEGKYKKTWTPYLFAGIGAAFVDPTPDFNENDGFNATKLSLINQDKNADISSIVPAIPLGAGFKFDLSPKTILGIEGGFRPPLTDYLDGISLAANPDKNDWYAFGGATITFRLGESNSNPTETITEVLDTDGDGVPDSNDLCPTVVGKAMFGGCPDTDNDGVADKDDACPTVAGNLAGCPDSDGDGIADNDDRCPNERGVASEGGCPQVVVVTDSDGDGVVDAEDSCPNAAGPANLLGCPDSDRDGIADISDKCPNVSAPGTSDGCPVRQVVTVVDTDNDGVPDSSDRCPNSAGSINNSGCPTISSADRAILDSAIRNVRFETSKSILKSESYTIMDQIADIMNRYPSYSLTIGGHTDSVGDSASNQYLSEKRARTCFDYLVRKGISATRMTHNGYGETQPIADNNTREGRYTNRRVEFNLFLR